MDHDILQHFFLDFDETKTEDLGELYDKYVQFKKYLSFPNLKILFRKNSNSLLKNLSDIVKISRSICLLNLSHCDDFNYFDCPSLEEMFETAFKVPPKINQHFQNEISQSLTNVIGSIHSDHTAFSKMVIDYFGLDLSLHSLFGLSTFPALYGFFCTQTMCKLGKDLLMDFIYESEQNYLFDAMMTSYFNCAFQFFITLFDSFVSIISESSFTTDISTIFTALLESITCALPFLSEYHIDMLIKYHEKDHTSFSSFLSRLFKSNFEIYTLKEYIPYKTKQKCYELFKNIETHIEYSLTIYARLTFRQKIITSPPNAPLLEELPLMPLELSDRDILIILEIMKDKPNLLIPLKKLANENSLFKNGYAPFIFEMHYPIPEPPKPSAPDSDKYNSKYLNFCKQFNDRNVPDFVEFIKQKYQYDKNDPFILYFFRMEISKLRCKYKEMDIILNQMERSNIFTDYKKILLEAQNSIVHLHSKLLMKQFLPEKQCKIDFEQSFNILKEIDYIVRTNSYPRILLLAPMIFSVFSSFNADFSYYPTDFVYQCECVLGNFICNDTFESIKPLPHLVSFANRLFKSVEIKKDAVSKGTLAEIFLLLIQLSRGTKKLMMKNDKYAFWRWFFPNKNGINAESIKSCIRIVIAFFEIRKIIINLPIKLNYNELLTMYSDVENYIYYPFLMDDEFNLHFHDLFNYLDSNK